MTDVPAQQAQPQGSLATYEKRDMAIINKKGLHARAAAKFVRTVGGYGAKVWVSKDGNRVAGDAIMDLLMLAASQGCSITVEADGPDAANVLSALEALINNRFDEAE